MTKQKCCRCYKQNKKGIVTDTLNMWGYFIWESFLCINCVKELKIDLKQSINKKVGIK